VAPGRAIKPCYPRKVVKISRYLIDCAFYSLVLFYEGAVSEVVPVTKASTVHPKSPRRDAAKASTVHRKSPRRDGPAAKASTAHLKSPRRDSPATKASAVRNQTPDLFKTLQS